MNFNNLEEKCNYFRGLTDYRVMPNGYTLAMLDGRAFSRLIKKKYRLPFDDAFINIMDETAKYLLTNIQGAKFAYVQSDEISILITDWDEEGTDSCFGFRLCKMQSIFASMAASKFNQLTLLNDIWGDAYDRTKMDTDGTLYRVRDAVEIIRNQKLAEFDCKVWSVPDWGSALGHFVWRQNDCTRNSKQQTAQSVFSHKQLMGKSADEQIEMCKAQNVFWDDFDPGKKYGRLIYREPVEKETTYTNKKTGETNTVKFTRNEFTVHGAQPFGYEDNVIRTLIPKR